MPPELRYPSADGLGAILEALDAIPAAREAAYLPVFVAVHGALADGDYEDRQVDGTDRSVVPNPELFRRLDDWFGVPGNSDTEYIYFSPTPLPGGQSRHWRKKGIVAQNTMTRLHSLGWVDSAIGLAGQTRGYPLLDLDSWHDAVVLSLGDDDGIDGIDVAAFAVWLGRTSGIPCEGETPTREELAAFAIDRLGLEEDSALLVGDPALFWIDGPYQPVEAHFQAAPLDDAAVLAAAVAIDGAGGDNLTVPPAATTLTDDDWLQDRFGEWIAESGYPGEGDDRNKQMRGRFADELFSEEALRNGQLDLGLLRRFTGNNYGNPGNQSGFLRNVRDNPEAATAHLTRAIHHLLYGSGDVSERITSVLLSEGWEFPGFKEALVTKCLAVHDPDHWLPLFVYRSGQGVGKRDILRVARCPAINESGKTVGQIAVESNDVLRDRVEHLLPGDPWGQTSFLWWLRGWVPASSLADELLLPQEWLDEVRQLTQDKPQLIFYGPPGTGKTFVAKRLAQTWADPLNVKIVQFHPSYAYEDFVQGFRPVEDDDNGDVQLKLRPGPLMKLAERAVESGELCVIVIDEINRGNIAKIFGELYFLLEYRDEAIELQYGDSFSLPDNLIVIGTMNTADRSIALLDSALRRRFHFVPFFPDRKPIDGLLRRWLTVNKPEMLFVADLVDTVNEMLDDHHLQIGPSHFMTDALDDPTLERIWTYSILPYVEEHFFDDPDRVEAFELSKLRPQLPAESQPAGEEAPEAPGNADDVQTD